MKRMTAILLALWMCANVYIKAYADRTIFSFPEDVTSVDVKTVLKTSENIEYSDVFLSSSILSIDTTSFLYDQFDSVQDYSVDPSNPSFCSIDGVVFSKDCCTLVAFPRGRMIKDYIIPEGVVIIGCYAFAQTNIETVVLPSSLKTIEKGAFCESAINRIVFNEGLEQIGDRAFESCALLQEVAFPPTLKNIGAMAFSACPIKNVIIPEGVEMIGNEAFFYCPLESIRLPSTVVECGELIIGRNNSTVDAETTIIIVPMGTMIDMYITNTMGYYPIVRENN